MGIPSINEPGSGHTWSLGPESINEPPNYSAMEEPPAITALTPDSCVIGDADFTLYISGTGFYPDSVINFAEHDEPTTLNRDRTLSTGVKPSLWGSPVVVQVYVRNGPVFSNAVMFSFNDVAQRQSDDDEFEPTHRTKRKRH